jgi:hypothetical protein
MNKVQLKEHIEKIINYVGQEYNHGPKLVINESKEPVFISEGLYYHIENNLPVNESIYRPQSAMFLKLFVEVRNLYNDGRVQLCESDQYYFDNTDIGTFGEYNGIKVPLDLPLTEEFLTEVLEEADKKKKDPPIGKPKRGGSKKFYVYVRKPGGGIKKVSFGMAGGGLRAKLNNPKARQAFSKRHNCPQKKDRTTASYWSCRLPRYAKLLGFKTSFSGFW